MITITASNGTRGSGETVAAACRQMLGSQRMAVIVGRATVIPIEEATVGDLRNSGAIYVSKDRFWRVGLLINEVAEGAQA